MRLPIAARWNALVAAQVEYSKPRLDFTSDTARVFLDPEDCWVMHTASACSVWPQVVDSNPSPLALLGADVTVLDLSDKQLEQDQAAAAHYGLDIRTVQGDMRRLAAFSDCTFDLVYHDYSINFVPNVAPVIAEVARVIRPSGLYRVQWANPFVQTVEPELDWTGTGYLIRHPYVDGREISELFPTWSIQRADGSVDELIGPREFVHTISTMINTLTANCFVVLRCREETGTQEDAPPGSWRHYMRIAPPYLCLWTRYLPAAFAA